jgi:hypothetical protein
LRRSCNSIAPKTIKSELLPNTVAVQRALTALTPSRNADKLGDALDALWGAFWWGCAVVEVAFAAAEVFLCGNWG